jgi:hypothetical protein
MQTWFELCRLVGGPAEGFEECFNDMMAIAPVLQIEVHRRPTMTHQA